ncbi:hypothetical protein D3C78_1434090 [compost metagenome]
MFSTRCKLIEYLLKLALGNERRIGMTHHDGNARKQFDKRIAHLDIIAQQQGVILDTEPCRVHNIW